MRTVDIALSLAEWAGSVVPELNTEPYQAEQIAQALPAVVCAVNQKRKSKSDQPKYQYQQTAMRIWEATLLLLVSPENPWAATQFLYNAVDDLEAALSRDPTLGGRVPIADSIFSASFVPPELQHQDGTVARAATMILTVGEQVKDGN